MKNASRPSPKTTKIVAGYVLVPASVTIDYSFSQGGTCFVQPLESNERHCGEWEVRELGSNRLLGALTDDGCQGASRWSFQPASDLRANHTGLAFELRSRLLTGRTSADALAQVASWTANADRWGTEQRQARQLTTGPGETPGGFDREF